MIPSMGGPKHDAAALARFQDGETRLVFARHKERPHDPPFYLEDGQAAEHREFTREHLECFMPECDARRLKAVSRSKARDGFAHYAGAGRHTPESLFHQQAKALIVRWVTKRYPTARAVAEQTTESGERRADVMVTGPDGRQVAIEVQYAPLPVAEWQERTESYRNQGITPVWLLGHVPPHLRASRTGSDLTGDPDGLVSLGALHQAMAERGHSILWINPVAATIRTTWRTRSIHLCRFARCGCPTAASDLFQVLPTAEDTSGCFRADALDDCILTPAGISTPTLRDVIESTGRARVREEQLRAREAERAKVAAAQAAAREAAAQAERDQYAAWFASRQQSFDQRWLKSPLRRRLLKRHGCLPEVLTAALPHDRGVMANHEHWHAVVYAALIEGRAEGFSFRFSECDGAIRNQGLKPSTSPAVTARQAITGFLHHLTDHGLIQLRKDRYTGLEGGRVIGDVTNAADRLARREAEAQARQDTAERDRVRKEEMRDWIEQRSREARQRQAETAARRRRREAQYRPTVPPPNMTPDGPRYTHCRACGTVLDPTYAASGYHTLCRPEPLHRALRGSGYP